MSRSPILESRREFGVGRASPPAPVSWCACTNIKHVIFIIHNGLLSRDRLRTHAAPQEIQSSDHWLLWGIVARATRLKHENEFEFHHRPGSGNRRCLDGENHNYGLPLRHFYDSGVCAAAFVSEVRLVHKIYGPEPTLLQPIRDGTSGVRRRSSFRDHIHASPTWSGWQYSIAARWASWIISTSHHILI